MPAGDEADPSGRSTEVALVGGTTNRGLVTRVGSTVRRPTRPTSSSTWSLLRHLEQVGFAGAPRILGTDSSGREVLTFVEGEVATPPYPAWALTDEALRSVAVLLRDYHEAAASFEPSGHEWFKPVPLSYRGPLVTHNDPNLDNIVFRAGRAVALIDFDLAAPGSAVWDVACAARLWSPLRDPADVPAPLSAHVLDRLRAFLDTYGLDAGGRAAFAEAVVAAHSWCYAIVSDAVDDGHPAFTPYWEQGGAELAVRTRDWLLAHQEQITAAVV